MPFLRGFALKNFRTFRDEAAFEIAPLTLLVGPNSSGKSSLLKALLLLSENRPLGDLTFGTGEHGLSGFDAVLADKERQALEFKLAFKGGLGNTLPLPLETADEEELRQSHIESGSFGVPWDWPAHVHLSFQLVPGGMTWFSMSVPTSTGERHICTARVYERTHEVYDRFADRTNIFELSELEVEVDGAWFFERLGGTPEDVLNSLRLDVDGSALVFAEQLNGRLTLSSIVGEDPFFSLDQLVNALAGRTISGFRPTSGSSAFDTDDRFKAFQLHTLGPLLGRCLRAYDEIFKGLEYVPVHRDAYRRITQPTPEERSLFDLLAQLGDEPVVESDWLKRFGVADALTIEKVDDQAYRLSVVRGEQTLAISEVGYGHQRLIPLILHLKARTQKSLLLIEEPEASLHPNLQAQLADFFVELSGRYDEVDLNELMDWLQSGRHKHLLKKQLIVETHSEYLVRRLQYLVATGEADPDRIVIYNLGPDPLAADYIRKIRIEPSGQLSQEFGAGFYDQATSLMVNLYKASHQN